MTDKIKYLEDSGAVFLGASNMRALGLANAAFQQMRASVLPKILAEFYMALGGAFLGDAIVFPIEDAERPDRRYVLPGIVGANRALAGAAALRGKTVWGKNALYIFSADAAGNFYMHDILTLSELRKYSDFAPALTDCLLVGKI